MPALSRSVSPTMPPEPPSMMGLGLHPSMTCPVPAEITFHRHISNFSCVSWTKLIRQAAVLQAPSAVTHDWKTIVGSGNTLGGMVETWVLVLLLEVLDDVFTIELGVPDVGSIGVTGIAVFTIFAESYPPNDWVSVRGSTGIPEVFVNPSPERLLSLSSLEVEDDMRRFV